MSVGQLKEVETGRILVARLEIADTAWERSVGLLGRRALPPDGGLWIEPCNGVHTLLMTFPIDVLFLDRDGKILRSVSYLKPWRFCGPVRGVRTVVELPAGTLATLHLSPLLHYSCK